MKRIPSLIVKTLVMIQIGGAALANNLHAQSSSGMTVSIPFSFTVGTQSIPAGTYRFSLTSSSFEVDVLNVKTGSEQFFIVRPETEGPVEPKGRLIFRNSEECSTLSEIHFPGTDTFSAIEQLHGVARTEAKKFPAGNTIAITQASRSPNSLCALSNR